MARWEGKLALCHSSGFPLILARSESFEVALQAGEALASKEAVTELALHAARGSHTNLVHVAT